MSKNIIIFDRFLNHSDSLIKKRIQYGYLALLGYCCVATLYR